MDASDLPQPWNEDHKILPISITVRLVTSGDSQDDVKFHPHTAMTAELTLQSPGCMRTLMAQQPVQYLTEEQAYSIHLLAAYYHSRDTNWETLLKLCNRTSGPHASSFHDSRLAEKTSTQAVFLSDVVSSLEALAGDKLPRVMEKLPEHTKNRRVVLQWVPAHCRVPPGCHLQVSS